MTRPGYSAVRQTVSELSEGADGWVQVANFIVFGLLSLAFAVGAGRSLTGGRAAVAVSLLLAAFEIALKLAGIFLADGNNHVRTVHGAVHAAVSAVAFTDLGLAGLVFAWHIVRHQGWNGLAAYSLATGLAIPLLWLLSRTLTALQVTGIIERVSIAVGWMWIVVLAAWLLQGLAKEATIPAGSGGLTSFRWRSCRNRRSNRNSSRGVSAK